MNQVGLYIPANMRRWLNVGLLMHVYLSDIVHEGNNWPGPGRLIKSLYCSSDFQEGR